LPLIPSEPAKAYWTIGIVASVALHASAVAGAVLLADRYARSAVHTEITFSDEASPIATPAPSEAEVAAVSETAQMAEQEKLAPADPEAVTKPASETLQPLQADPAQTAEQETITPLGVEAAPSPSTQTVKPEQTEVAAVSETEPASKPDSEAIQPVESDSLSESVQPEKITGTSPETAQPIAPSEAPSEGSQETATVVSDSDALTASDSTERPASTEPSTIAPPPDEAAERISALEQPSGTPLTSSETVEQVAALTADQPASTTVSAPPESTSESVTSLQPEALQPSDAVVAPTSTAPTKPEVIQPAVGTMDGGAGSTGVAPLPTEVLQPTTGGQGSVTGRDAVIPGVSDTIQPVEQEVETALLVPARPDSSLGTEVDKPTDRYRRIVDFVRQYAGGDCFIALPAMSPDGAVTFQTFGRDKVREEAFKAALSGIDGFQAEVSNGDIADPQCLALSFARTTKRYPGFSLMIDLDEADIASGTRLSGKVLNAGERELHLLLIDDEGKVQSLDKVLEPGNATDRPFGTPLTLTSGPVVTKQILIAVATDKPLAALVGPLDQPATEYFAKLEQEIDATGADVDLAVEGFSVR
jgi:hypothetical protein